MLGLAVLVAQAAPSAALTFEESVALAAQHNAGLRNAKANLLAAEERARAAYSGFLPQLSGTVSYNDTSGSAISTIGSASDYTTGLTLTQNLFAGFQDRARVEQGSANIQSASAALVNSKAQLSRDLKAAYAGLLYAQDNVKLSTDILRRREENVRLVELRFENGRENKGAYLLTRASVAQARLDQLQAQQGLVSAQTQLANITGQSLGPTQAASTVPVAAPPTAPDFGALVQQTPDVLDAAARERLARADVQLARAGFYPTANVSATVARDGETWYPTGDRRSVNASVSIPLFSGGRDYYGVRGALAASDAAKANRESVEGQILVQLTQSYASYVESVERLNVDREFLTATDTRANIARARYQNGLISFDEWDRAENDLIQRQRALLASSRDRVNAEAAWEFAQGRGVIP